MSTYPSDVWEPSSDRHTATGKLYSDAARDHLWIHFTRHSTFEEQEAGGLGHAVPIITRGEGWRIWDLASGEEQGVVEEIEAVAGFAPPGPPEWKLEFGRRSVFTHVPTGVKIALLSRSCLAGSGRGPRGAGPAARPGRREAARRRWRAGARGRTS